MSHFTLIPLDNYKNNQRPGQPILSGPSAFPFLRPCLYLSHLHVEGLFTGIVFLVLILRFLLFRNAVELISVLLPIDFFLFLLIHVVTSQLVCSLDTVIYTLIAFAVKKEPVRFPTLLKYTLIISNK